MSVTTYGLGQSALRLGSNSDRIAAIAIGSGSGVVLASNKALAAEYDRNVLTSTDLSVAQQVSWTANWSSVELSGTVFREFGSFAESGAGLGSCWQREAINGSITFTGTSEMQVELQWQTF